MGTPINVAFRVQALTAGGEILVTESVYNQVANHVLVGPEREAELKGIDGRVKVYPVLGSNASRS